MSHPMMKIVAASLLFALPYSGYATETANHSDRLLQLANDTELAHAETQAAMAKLEAIRAKQKLTAPKQGQNAIERTTQTNNQMGGNNTAVLTRSPIDSVELKSLVTTSGVTTAWIALDGELIEVKKGSQVGALKVIDLDENSVRFSDGHKTKRKWMAGFKAKPTPQTPSARGR